MTSEAVDYRTELQLAVLSGLACTADEPEELSTRFHYAQHLLRDEFFAGLHLPIWQILERYFAIAGVIPSAGEFTEILESSANISVDDKVALSAAYSELAANEYTSLARFKIGVTRLRERWRDDSFSTILNQATRIHMGAAEIGGEQFSGFEDAKGYLVKELVQIDSLTAGEELGGNINLEGQDVLRSYLSAKETHEGLLTGFHELDELTGGIQAGELWLVAGFTGEGKSKVSFNIAYNSCYLQGKGVLLGAAEQTREQVRRNMICLHSRHQKFDHPTGLRYHDLRMGRLNEQDEELLRLVLRDMAEGERAGEYGRMYIFAVPHNASITYVAGILDRESRSAAIDLLVVDYLGLLTSTSKRVSRREELDDLVRAAKRLATDSNKGQGLAVLSPWQMTRDAWKRALDKGSYDLASLSDTSQAERSTDLILSILGKPEEPGTLFCQVLKYRDGEGAAQFTLNTDFATSYVGSGQAQADILL